MRVVHTWTSDNIIWKEEAYIHLASTLSAQKYYGNIDLYADKKSIQQIQALKIPYTKLVEIAKLDYNKTFSIPKLDTFSKLDQSPNLHIDTDTILFNKIDFSNYSSSYVFSHCDKHMNKIKMKYRESLNSVLSAPANKEDDFHSMLYKTYLKAFFHLHDKLPDSIVQSVDLGSIPNMNVICAKEPKLLAEASVFATKHYFENKEYIDSLQLGACYVEQFLLHMYLRAHDTQYKKQSTKLKHTLYHSNPLYQIHSPGLETDITKSSFPIKFSYEQPRCSCCNRKGKVGEFFIYSIEDVKSLFTRKYGSYLHFSFMTWYDIWQCYVINHLVEEYGADKVKNVHNFYLDEYKNYNLPLISGGEKLYEKLTGNKLFTK